MNYLQIRWMMLDLYSRWWLTGSDDMSIGHLMNDLTIRENWTYSRTKTNQAFHVTIRMKMYRQFVEQLVQVVREDAAVLE